MNPTININTTDFARALREYAAYTKKDMAVVINKKAFWVARNAVRSTYKADPKDIKSAMHQLVYVDKAKAAQAGKEPKQAPLVGAIVEKQDKSKFGKGYSPRVPTQLEAFRKRIKTFINKRRSATAYMKSGWKPAVKEFAAAIGRASMESLDKKGKDYDWSAMGGAKRATVSAKWLAELWNTALNPKTINQPGEGDRLFKHAGKALQKAIDQETASMDKYIADQMQKNSDKIMAKVFK